MKSNEVDQKMCKSTVKLYPTILCGGSGRRLWPLSRINRPKQFLSLINQSTLFENTYKRAKALSSSNTPLVVTLENHKHLVAEQLSNYDAGANILCEPEGKNTCPAITAATMDIFRRDKDALVLMLPSDHHFENEEILKKAIRAGIPLAETNNLVMFGIKPQSAHTGFGYIKIGRQINEGFSVENFTEKPEKKEAENFLNSGKYLWNSGIFLFKAEFFLDTVERLAPETFNHVCRALDKSVRNAPFTILDRKGYQACPSESVDLAIMEKTKDLAIIPVDLDWNDIGSWESLGNVVRKDEKGNNAVGDVILKDSSGTLVRAESRLVAVLGIKDSVIIETLDSVLVASKEHAQKVNELVSSLEQKGREEVKQTRVCQRPWGSFEAVANGDNYQVKRLSVNPGESLSLQKHRHRSEHWTVVAGTATVEIDDRKFQLNTDQSTYIAAGSKHRLSNKTEKLLEIIEVQTGAYLGEDDITRYEDFYGRADSNYHS